MSLAYPPHGPKDRFKVVKIEKSMPIRRGRWNVVDYPDKGKKEGSSQPQASVTVPPSAPFASIDTSDASSSASKTAPVTAITQPATVTPAGPEQQQQPGASSSQSVAAVASVAPTAGLPAGSILAQAEQQRPGTVRTVTAPSNLHNIGAMAPQPQVQPTAGAVDPNLTPVVVTNHLNYPGPQVHQAPHQTIPPYTLLPSCASLPLLISHAYDLLYNAYSYFLRLPCCSLKSG